MLNQGFDQNYSALKKIFSDKKINIEGNPDEMLQNVQSLDENSLNEIETSLLALESKSSSSDFSRKNELMALEKFYFDLTDVFYLGKINQTYYLELANFSESNMTDEEYCNYLPYVQSAKLNFEALGNLAEVYSKEATEFESTYPLTASKLNFSKLKNVADIYKNPQEPANLEDFINQLIADCG